MEAIMVLLLLSCAIVIACLAEALCSEKRDHDDACREWMGYCKEVARSEHEKAELTQRLAEYDAKESETKNDKTRS